MTRHVVDNENTSKNWDGLDIEIDLFDQGRSGVGGRSSHRLKSDEQNGSLRWDHGCQFFRADTPIFKKVVKNWIDNNVAEEWKGRFAASPPSDSSANANLDFFGLPSSPPFYVGVDGMRSIPARLLSENVDNSSKVEDNGDNAKEKSNINNILELLQGTRVARMERNEVTQRWILFGTSGEGAFHDTSEEIAKKTNEVTLGRVSDGDEAIAGYDAVILTDVSSSFGKWHRASAGVPEVFAKRVRRRIGARVPLFATMIAFDKELEVPFDAISFREKNTPLWFAARTNAKPLLKNEEKNSIDKDCWTLISTPEYAMEKIAETPMQDPTTGEFIPQSRDYLISVPGADLEKAFRNEVVEQSTGDPNFKVPNIVYMDAQRWGSALPCHRHLDGTSTTLRIISGVPYDSHRSPLAPTKEEVLSSQRQDEEATNRNFLLDDSLMLYQAGDMMSTYTPGYEGAALSGIEAAEHLIDQILLLQK
mmetsp:Transcript_11587/g.16235  ORF Transcript_11587/g.16235 Transcript_11587/m.16235 type:complete len:477 (-) Transcript_11587:171-1601(-)